QPQQQHLCSFLRDLLILSWCKSFLQGAVVLGTSKSPRALFCRVLLVKGETSALQTELYTFCSCSCSCSCPCVCVSGRLSACTCIRTCSCTSYLHAPSVALFRFISCI